MTERVEIRESVQDDWVEIEALYTEAFPDENLLPLVADLMREDPAALSLVATTDLMLLGHVIFTKCHGSGDGAPSALLGPLAVTPARQRRGIGTAIVRDGLHRLEDAGVVHVYVLGDPAFYGRLGFRAETRVAPPYELPPEWAGAWQSQNLIEGERPRSGKLLLPRPWLQPALWAP